jgi:hypothetical protein
MVLWHITTSESDILVLHIQEIARIAMKKQPYKKCRSNGTADCEINMG